MSHSSSGSVVRLLATTGFFANKEADAKARGEAPPKKRTAEEAFSEFMASVSSDVRQVRGCSSFLQHPQPPSGAAAGHVRQACSGLGSLPPSLVLGTQHGGNVVAPDAVTVLRACNMLARSFSPYMRQVCSGVHPASLARSCI